MQLGFRDVASLPYVCVFFAALCLNAPHAWADEAARVDDAAEANQKLPLWEAGLFGFGLNQPAYPGAEDHTKRALVLPFFVYRGRYFRADRGSVGVRALKTPRVELDVGFSGSLGSHSSDIAVRSGMPDLGTLIEFGPRMKVNLGDTDQTRPHSILQFPLRDVIDVSHGFRSRGIAFEPQWVAETTLPEGRFFSATLGALFGDQSLNDMLYGVAPEYVTATRSGYTAKAGLIALRAGLRVSHKLSSAARIFYLLRVESLRGAVNRESPLFRRDVGWSVGVGFAWTLFRSERSAYE